MPTEPTFLPLIVVAGNVVAGKLATAESSLWAVPSQTEVFGWKLMVPVPDKAALRDFEQSVALWLEEETWKGLDHTTNPHWRTRREWLPLPDGQTMLCLSLASLVNQPSPHMAATKAHLQGVVDRMKSPCVPLTPKIARYRMMGLDLSDTPELRAIDQALDALVEQWRLAHLLDLPARKTLPVRQNHL